MVADGAGLWPFDGDLREVVAARAVTVAETYPAEYYRRLGLHAVGPWSKRRQADRADRTDALAEGARDLGARLAPPVATAVRDGFGPGADGEDRFDALVGLLGMLRALEDGAPAPDGSAVRDHEGWILGQALPD